MRIDKLHLPYFKGFRDFHIDFDETSDRTVLIGRNGVGKTNLLEALTLVFRYLDLRSKEVKEPLPFPFGISYVCSGQYVTINATVAGVGGATTTAIEYFVRASKSDPVPKALSESAFFQLSNENRLIPKHVFGYYSGTSRRLRSLFEAHTEIYRSELISGQEDTIRPLFFAEDWHSQFVLLSFFAKKDEDTEEFLREQMKIGDLESVLFTLNQPYWYKKNPTRQAKDRGDARYWWAAGTVKKLLDGLHTYSLAPMRTLERVQIDIGRTATKEKSYCYLPNRNALVSLAQGIDQKELFKRLESTVLSDLLSSVITRFSLVDGRGSLTFEELSEGEQQLLTVLGLLRFTSQEESLFLLDEPDTHLNPAWSLDYLDILRRYGGTSDNSQLLITTHSPLVFAGLERNEVILLERKSEDGSISAEHPTSSPKGMGFSAILTSEFFGLRSTVDRETADLLDEKRHLSRISARTPEQDVRLAWLNDNLKNVDFVKIVRDPLYASFVDAMTDAEHEDPTIASPVLSATALERRKARARQALALARDRT